MSENNYGIKWAYEKCWFDANYIIIPVPTNLNNSFVKSLIDKFGSVKIGKKCLHIKEFTQKNNMIDNLMHDKINKTITAITNNKICKNVADIVLGYSENIIQCDVILYKYHLSNSVHIIFMISFGSLIRRFPFKIRDDGNFEILNGNGYYYDGGLLSIMSSHLLQTDITFFKQNVGGVNLDVTYGELKNMINALRCVEENDEKTKAILYYDKNIAMLVNRNAMSLKIIHDLDLAVTTCKFTTRNTINIPQETFFSIYEKELTKFCEMNINKYIVMIKWDGCCVAQFTKKQLHSFINEYKNDIERKFSKIILDLQSKIKYNF